jgi:hypothetical protein
MQQDHVFAVGHPLPAESHPHSPVPRLSEQKPFLAAGPPPRIAPDPLASGPCCHAKPSAISFAVRAAARAVL